MATTYYEVRTSTWPRFSSTSSKNRTSPYFFSSLPHAALPLKKTNDSHSLPIRFSVGVFFSSTAEMNFDLLSWDDCPMEAREFHQVPDDFQTWRNAKRQLVQQKRNNTKKARKGKWSILSLPRLFLRHSSRMNVVCNTFYTDSNQLFILYTILFTMKTE